MFFIVGLIALALSITIATVFGLQHHPGAGEVFVLMVFASPTIAAVYGALTLIVCNSVATRLGWPELSLPWWPQRRGRTAVIISWYIVAGWLGVFIGIIAFAWWYTRL